MKIGELAQATGTPIETIRYYEREHLLPAPLRTAGNYRSYDEAHTERLSFIRYCRGLDMTLSEIRVLLHFKDEPSENCGEVNALLDEHLGHVAERIRELRKLERQLRQLRNLCQETQEAAQCGILTELSHAAQGPGAESLPGAGGYGHVHGAHSRQSAKPRSNRNPDRSARTSK